MTRFIRSWGFGGAFRKVVEREAEKCDKAIADLWAKQVFGEDR